MTWSILSSAYRAWRRARCWRLGHREGKVKVRCGQLRVLRCAHCGSGLLEHESMGVLQLSEQGYREVVRELRSMREEILLESEERGA